MSESDKKETKNKKEEKRNRRVKRWQKILIGTLAVLLVILGGGYGFVMHKVGQIEKDTSLDLTQLKTVEVPGYRNIILLGVDSRDMTSTEGTRTDAIMVASINELNQEVTLTSVYRDTLLKMGNTDTYEKATHAHAYGGPEMTITMLDQALDIDATEYILFNFKAVADAVDAVGGITVDVKEKEVYELNRITADTAMHLGHWDYQLSQGPGEQTLTGVQAVAYGRIRKGVGDDYARTGRMRRVVEILLEKVRGMSVGEINDLLSIVLPQIKTNLTNNQILSLAGDVGKYQITDSFGFPYQKFTTSYGGASVVVPIDLEADVVQWHKEVFGETEFVLSPEAKAVSDYIKEALGPQIQAQIDKDGDGVPDEPDADAAKDDWDNEENW